MKQKNTKRALLLSALSLLMCVSMLIGSTFAWFTDSVTSTGNKIQAGTLKIDLELLDKTSGSWSSIKEDKTALFDYNLWEPGYTDVKILKVENEGSLALKWMAKFVSEEDLSILADVIDVYVCPSATALTYPADRDLTGYEYVGTVRDFVNTIETTTYGSLKAEEEAYLGIALKMQESADNNYMGLTLGEFDIMILATQDTVENDSFDNNYDADAEYDKVQLPAKNITVTSTEELTAAFAAALDGEQETIIDAKGVTVDINSLGTVMGSSGIMAYEIPGGVTIKNLSVVGSYRGGNYLMFEGKSDQEIVFENCTFEPSGRAMGLGFCGSDGGSTSVVYNNCSFRGPVVTNFVDNTEGIATFNNCTFTKHTSGNNYVMAMGGTHIFNGCTFDYTGVTQTNIGTANTGCVNAVSDSDGSYSTAVVLNGCVRTNCGTRTYGPNSSLVVE